jgi:hypothetical protein
VSEQSLVVMVSRVRVKTSGESRAQKWGNFRVRNASFFPKPDTTTKYFIQG